MNLKDVITILTEYDIRHIENTTEQDVWGAFNPNKQVLTVFVPQLMFQRRQTVMHELLHAYYLNEGVTRTEEEVEEEAKYMVQEMEETK